MYQPGCLIATEKRCKPGKLNRLVNGKPCNDRTSPENYYTCISNLLSTVKLRDRRRFFTQTEVMKCYFYGIFKRPFARNQVLPFSREKGITYIAKSVKHKYPHKYKVPGHSDSKVKRNIESFIKPFRKKFYNYLSSGLNAVFIISPVNPEAAPKHQCEYREVYPMKPSYCQWMFFSD